MKSKVILISLLLLAQSVIHPMDGPIHLEPLPGEHGFDPVDPHDGRPDGDPFAEGGRDLADRPVDEMTPEERAAWEAQQDESGYGSLPGDNEQVLSNEGILQPPNEGGGNDWALVGNQGQGVPVSDGTLPVVTGPEGGLDQLGPVEVQPVPVQQEGAAQNQLNTPTTREAVEAQMVDVLGRAADAMFADQLDSAQVAQVLSELDALTQSELLSEAEKANLQRIRDEFDSQIPVETRQEMAQLGMVDNIVQAYQQGDLTRADAQKLLNNLGSMKENPFSQAVKDKIAIAKAVFIDPVGTLTGIKKAASEVATQRFQTLASSTAKDMQDITKALRNYKSSKDATIQKKFENIAQKFADAKVDFDAASETRNLLSQLATADKNPRFVEENNGAIDVAATKASIESLMSTELGSAQKRTIAGSILGETASTSGFTGEVKKVETQATINKLKDQLGADAPEWLASLTVANDGAFTTSSGPLADAQREEVANIWLQKVKKPSMWDMQREPLQIIAKATEVNLPNGQARDALRDIGQELSHDFLFERFKAQFKDGANVSLTPSEQDQIMQMYMDAVQNPGVEDNVVNFDDAMKNLYRSWQSKKG